MFTIPPDLASKAGAAAATGFLKIRMGPGVVGRGTWVVLGAFALLAIMAMMGTPWQFLLPTFIFTFVLGFGGLLAYGHQHPDHSAMEGSELASVRVAELAAKGFPMIPANMPSSEPPER